MSMNMRNLFDDDDDYDVDLPRVCIRHLAFVPCRHGREDDPCFVTEDRRAVTLVRNYHTIKEHEQ